MICLEAGKLGGTAWRHLLNLEYGCRRRLYYELAGEKANFTEPHKSIFDRGWYLEPAIARLYCESTGARLRGPENTVLPRDAWLPDWWRGHPDRIIVSHPRAHGTGILECKTAGTWPYRKMESDGLPLPYVYQLQHYLALTGCAWGAFAVLEVDDRLDDYWTDMRKAGVPRKCVAAWAVECVHSGRWKFEAFAVHRDRDRIRYLLGEGRRFMGLKEPPDRPPDVNGAAPKTCRECPYRRTCRGIGEAVEAPAYDEEVQHAPAELDGLFERAYELHEIKREAEAAYGAARAELEGALHAAALGPGIIAGPETVPALAWTKQRRRTFNSAQFRQENADLYADYVVENISDNLKWGGGKS